MLKHEGKKLPGGSYRLITVEAEGARLIIAFSIAGPGKETK